MLVLVRKHVALANAVRTEAFGPPGYTLKRINDTDPGCIKMRIRNLQPLQTRPASRTTIQGNCEYVERTNTVPSEEGVVTHSGVNKDTDSKFAAVADAAGLLSMTISG